MDTYQLSLIIRKAKSLAVTNHYVPTPDQLLPPSQDPWPFSWCPLLSIGLYCKDLPFPGLRTEKVEDNGVTKNSRKLCHHRIRGLWLQSGASPARHLFNHFELSLVFPPLPSPRRAIWRTESPVLSLLIRLRPRDEWGLTQGHITSQTTTPVPALTDPGPLTHQAAFLFSKGQDGEEAALGFRVWASATWEGRPGTRKPWSPSEIILPSPYQHLPDLASLYLSELISQPPPPIHSAPATVTSFQPQGLCTCCDCL